MGLWTDICPCLAFGLEWLGSMLPSRRRLLRRLRLLLRRSCPCLRSLRRRRAQRPKQLRQEGDTAAAAALPGAAGAEEGRWRRKEGEKEAWNAGETTQQQEQEEAETGEGGERRRRRRGRSSSVSSLSSAAAGEARRGKSVYRARKKDGRKSEEESRRRCGGARELAPHEEEEEGALLWLKVRGLPPPASPAAASGTTAIAAAASTLHPASRRAAAADPAAHPVIGLRPASSSSSPSLSSQEPSASRRDSSSCLPAPSAAAAAAAAPPAPPPPAPRNTAGASSSKLLLPATTAAASPSEGGGGGEISGGGGWGGSSRCAAVSRWTNGIRTTEYTWLSFFPKNLWSQVSQPANFYFLAMAALQMVPQVSDSDGLPTFLFPLLLVMTITAAKDAYENIKRARADQEENDRPCCVISPAGQQQMMHWRDLRPGYLVKLTCDDPVPADLLLLNCADPYGVAYVETVQLDGETNLKNKMCIPAVAARFKRDEDARFLNMDIEYEPPSAELYKFFGKIQLDPADAVPPTTPSKATTRWGRPSLLPYVGSMQHVSPTQQMMAAAAVDTAAGASRGARAAAPTAHAGPSSPTAASFCGSASAAAAASSPSRRLPPSSSREDSQPLLSQEKQQQQGDKLSEEQEEQQRADEKEERGEEQQRGFSSAALHKSECGMAWNEWGQGVPAAVCGSAAADSAEGELRAHLLSSEGADAAAVADGGDGAAAAPPASEEWACGAAAQAWQGEEHGSSSGSCEEKQQRLTGVHSRNSRVAFRLQQQQDCCSSSSRVGKACSGDGEKRRGSSSDSSSDSSIDSDSSSSGDSSRNSRSRQRSLFQGRAQQDRLLEGGRGEKKGEQQQQEEEEQEKQMVVLSKEPVASSQLPSRGGGGGEEEPGFLSSSSYTSSSSASLVGGMKDGREGRTKAVPTATALLLQQQIHHADISQVLWRGASLKNTAWAYGVVLYTGHHTRILMNTRTRELKYSRLQVYYNRHALTLAIVQVVLCLIMAVAYASRNQSMSDTAWYLESSWQSGVGNFFASLMVAAGRYILLLSYFVPITLLVQLEVCRGCQAAFLAGDEHMLCEATGKKASAQTVALMEELGSITHVFSDKTGTLTQNLMQFRCLAVGPLLHGFDEYQEMKSFVSQSSVVSSVAMPRLSFSFASSSSLLAGRGGLHHQEQQQKQKQQKQQQHAGSDGGREQQRRREAEEAEAERHRALVSPNKYVDFDVHRFTQRMAHATSCTQQKAADLLLVMALCHSVLPKQGVQQLLKTISVATVAAAAAAKKGEALSQREAEAAAAAANGNPAAGAAAAACLPRPAAAAANEIAASRAPAVGEEKLGAAAVDVVNRLDISSSTCLRSGCVGRNAAAEEEEEAAAAHASVPLITTAASHLREAAARGKSSHSVSSGCRQLLQTKQNKVSPVAAGGAAAAGAAAAFSGSQSTPLCASPPGGGAAATAELQHLQQQQQQMMGERQRKGGGEGDEEKEEKSKHLLPVLIFTPFPIHGRPPSQTPTSTNTRRRLSSLQQPQQQGEDSQQQQQQQQRQTSSRFSSMSCPPSQQQSCSCSSCCTPHTSDMPVGHGCCAAAARASSGRGTACCLPHASRFAAAAAAATLSWRNARVRSSSGDCSSSSSATESRRRNSRWRKRQFCMRCGGWSRDSPLDSAAAAGGRRRAREIETEEAAAGEEGRKAAAISAAARGNVRGRWTPDDVCLVQQQEKQQQRGGRSNRGRSCVSACTLSHQQPLLSRRSSSSRSGEGGRQANNDSEVSAAEMKRGSLSRRRQTVACSSSSGRQRRSTPLQLELVPLHAVASSTEQQHQQEEEEELELESSPCCCYLSSTPSRSGSNSSSSVEEARSCDSRLQQAMQTASPLLLPTGRATAAATAAAAMRIPGRRRRLPREGASAAAAAAVSSYDEGCAGATASPSAASAFAARPRPSVSPPPTYAAASPRSASSRTCCLRRPVSGETAAAAVVAAASPSAAATAGVPGAAAAEAASEGSSTHTAGTREGGVLGVLLLQQEQQQEASHRARISRGVAAAAAPAALSVDVAGAAEQQYRPLHAALLRRRMLRARDCSGSSRGRRSRTSSSSRSSDYRDWSSSECCSRRSSTSSGTERRLKRARSSSSSRDGRSSSCSSECWRLPHHLRDREGATDFLGSAARRCVAMHATEFQRSSSSSPSCLSAASAEFSLSAPVAHSIFFQEEPLAAAPTAPREPSLAPAAAAPAASSSSAAGGAVWDPTSSIRAAPPAAAALHPAGGNASSTATTAAAAASAASPSAPITARSSLFAAAQRCSTVRVPPGGLAAAEWPPGASTLPSSFSAAFSAVLRDHQSSAAAASSASDDAVGAGLSDEQELSARRQQQLLQPVQLGYMRLTRDAEYDASSPDELALTAAAKHMGAAFVSRPDLYSIQIALTSPYAEAAFLSAADREAVTLMRRSVAPQQQQRRQQQKRQQQHARHVGRKHAEGEWWGDGAAARDGDAAAAGGGGGGGDGQQQRQPHEAPPCRPVAAAEARGRGAEALSSRIEEGSSSNISSRECGGEGCCSYSAEEGPEARGSGRHEMSADVQGEHLTCGVGDAGESSSKKREGEHVVLVNSSSNKGEGKVVAKEEKYYEKEEEQEAAAGEEGGGGEGGEQQGLCWCPLVTFDVLEVMEFDNVRKRMSVVVRDREGRLRLLVKGADSSMMSIAAAGQEDMKEMLQEQLAEMASKGLRTLVMGQRFLKEAQLHKFQNLLATARAATGEKKDVLLREALQKIEKDVELLGASGIDDKLQDQVAETISDLKAAGVKLWVLTGDKTETAIAIGHSCAILTDATYNAVVDGKTEAEVKEQLHQYMSYIIAAQLASEAIEELLHKSYLPDNRPSEVSEISLGQEGTPGRRHSAAGRLSTAAADPAAEALRRRREKAPSKQQDHEQQQQQRAAGVSGPRGGGVCLSCLPTPLRQRANKCVRPRVFDDSETESLQWRRRREGPPTMPWEDFVKILTFNAKRKVVRADPKQRKQKRLSPDQVDAIVQEYLEQFDRSGDEGVGTRSINSRKQQKSKSSDFSAMSAGVNSGGGGVLLPSSSSSSADKEAFAAAAGAAEAAAGVAKKPAAAAAATQKGRRSNSKSSRGAPGVGGEGGEAKKTGREDQQHLLQPRCSSREGNQMTLLPPQLQEELSQREGQPLFDQLLVLPPGQPHDAHPAAAAGGEEVGEAAATETAAAASSDAAGRTLQRMRTRGTGTAARAETGGSRGDETQEGGGGDRRRLLLTRDPTVSASPPVGIDRWYSARGRDEEAETDAQRLSAVALLVEETGEDQQQQEEEEEEGGEARDWEAPTTDEQQQHDAGEAREWEAPTRSRAMTSSRSSSRRSSSSSSNSTSSRCRLSNDVMMTAVDSSTPAAIGRSSNSVLLAPGDEEQLLRSLTLSLRVSRSMSSAAVSDNSSSRSNAPPHIETAVAAASSPAASTPRPSSSSVASPPSCASPVNESSLSLSRCVQSLRRSVLLSPPASPAGSAVGVGILKPSACAAASGQAAAAALTATGEAAGAAKPPDSDERYSLGSSRKEKQKDHKAKNVSQSTLIVEPKTMMREAAVQAYEACAITITGEALGHVLASAENRRYFFGLANLCETVIGCRMTPKQKSELVAQCRRYQRGTVSLAIGDGANDVGMLVAANVGVGIEGREGLQAVRAADFAVGEFKFLRNILFCHGRESLRRSAFQLYQTIFRNVVFGLADFFFAFVSAFAASDLFNPWLKQLYNVLYTCIPVMLFSIFDRQLPYEVLLQTPVLYPAFSKLGVRMFVGTRSFWKWFLFSVYVSAAVVYVPLFGLGWGLAFTRDQGIISLSFPLEGAVVFWTIIIVCNLVMVPFLHTWYWFIWLGVVADFLFWYLSLFICPQLSGNFCTNLCGVLEATHSDPRYYFAVPLAVAAALLPQYIIWFVKVMRAPSAPCIIRERIAKGVFDIVVAPRGGQKMVVVVPKKGSNEWRGFAFAEQDNTRWGQHRRSIRLDEQPSAAAMATVTSKRRFTNSLRSRASRNSKKQQRVTPGAAAAPPAKAVAGGTQCVLDSEHLSSCHSSCSSRHDTAAGQPLRDIPQPAPWQQQQQQ